MKPNFALNFTHDGIALLHRTARGWLPVGETALDAPDLTQAIGYLRASALGLSPQGITSKLIIPNSQILYTEVDVTGTDAAARRAEVARALEGRTPYPVEELVFDIWGAGPRVQVAVVARETLDEAEGFAAQHRFNPVSCVAVPPEGAFGGEPFFGETRGAAAIIGAAESVARDDTPVVVLRRDAGRGKGKAARAPQADAAPAAEAAPAAAVASVAEALPAPAETAAPEVAAPEFAAPAPVPDASAVPEPVPAAVVPAEPSMAEPPPAEPPVAPAEAAPRAPDVRAAPEADTAPVADVPPDYPAPPLPTPMPQEWVGPRVSAPVVASSNPFPPPPPLRTAAPVVPEPEAPPTFAAAQPSPTFASRRRDEARAADPAPRPISEPAEPPVLRAPAGIASPAASLPGASQAAAGGLGAARSSRAAPAAPAMAAPPAVAPPPAAGQGAAPVASVTPLPTARPATPAPHAEPGGSPPRPAPVVNLPLRNDAKAQPRPRTGAPSTPLAPQRRPAVAASMAGGDGEARTLPPRPTTRVPPPTVAARGKPRYLFLILTGVLLLFLAVVATWSSLFLSEEAAPGARPSQLATAAPPPRAPDPVAVTAGETVAPQTALIAPEPATTQAGPAPVAVVEAPEPPADVVAEAEQPAAPAPDTAPVVLAAPALPEPAPQAATDAGAAAAPTAVAAAGTATTRQDEIFLAGVDQPPPALDATALPDPVTRLDAAPQAPSVPPPAGTVYRFDENGRLVADAEGIVAPGGFWLVAARPPRLPPPSPYLSQEPPLAAPDPAAATPADPAAAAPADAAPADAAELAATALPFQPDPDVPARRPPPRPETLAAPPQAQPAPQAAEDDAALPSADPRFALLRPRPRTAAVIALGEAARRDPEAAAAAEAAAVAATETAQVLPVALSRRPAPRPDDLSRAVSAAVAAATRPEPVLPPEPEPEARPEPKPERTAAAKPAKPPGEDDPPEADNEPETATAAPRIPTKASVANNATFANAINLAKVNLIGIYGTPSNRYAMVRTSAGRFTRVKVGDRVDGGTVAAITSSELRYQKGGRMLTLEMPRG